jgi:hypothetical protein
MLERWTKVSLASAVRPSKMITRRSQQNGYRESPPPTI